jgi:PhzF family phenazine biosynthesis protein
MKMKIPIFQIDAFTHEPFKGNPAAVCLLSKEMPEIWMQKIALEMNLSETAFLLKENEGYHLRWFTPVLEVDLCGHATLASAFVLYHKNLVKKMDLISFYSRSGELNASIKDDWITLNFPAFDEKPFIETERLGEILGVNPIEVVKSGENIIVELKTSLEIRQLKPDFIKLANIPYQGLAVTARSDNPKFDFISRYFAPRVGINEDPVTGSAHACLGPYWMKRLKNKMLAYQASVRGGIVKIEIQGKRVLLGGQAVMIFEGELQI